MRPRGANSAVMAVALGALSLLSLAGAAHPSQAAAPPVVEYALLVDNTGTMNYGDRGAMALVALSRLVDSMETGDRVSVFSYGEVARAVLDAYPVEIGDDASKGAVRTQLSFAFDADRTDITAGVDLVWRERERLFPSHYAGTGEAAVVLLTDGKLIPVYDDYSQYGAIYRESRSRLRELARAFGREGIPIHTIGLGSSRKVDAEHLRSIAEWSGGMSYHIIAARELPDVYSAVWQNTRPQVAAGSERESQTSSRGLRMIESATAREPAPAPQEGTVAPDSRPMSGFDLLYRGATGAIAVFLGLVVVGTRRRQPWTEFFTRTIGPTEQRVRGYLKPLELDGVQFARPIIGIENPGVPTLEIGRGTRYADFARETLIEFEGTRDGTPPTVNVLQGTVTVDGEFVTEPRKLRDGDVLNFEGVTYTYLRGNRR